MSDAAISSSDILELTIERDYAHPVSAVFEAWTRADALKHWMGPGEVECPDAEMEAREGGAYAFPMITPDGKNPVVRGTILEIVPNRKLRFTWAWDHEDGVSGAQMEVALDFHETDTGTRLVLHHINFADADSRDHHTQGWTGCMDKLEGFLGNA